MLADAPPGEERDALLAALEAEPPPPAPEIAWLFRRFCESTARKQPLVIVFDDVHWAVPTFLELVEHLAEKGEGPIHVVCLAREELAESSPDFLERSSVTDRIELDALSLDETHALVDGLGGEILESDQRTRVVEAAEGNPLFLEQLLALALEGGLSEQRVPETIHALLAARLDRLGPGERAVLERGAVVGKEFTADDVVGLLEPEAVATADSHLATLVGRGFVRPRGEGILCFRHALVQDAVYRAAPKRLRAELHERYADRLDATARELIELDEFVGYHLEQAYRLRSELGESDRRREALGEDAGRRLAAAGMRAFRRGDMHATAGLLGRASALARADGPLHREVLCDLGIARYAARDSERAVELLTESISESREAGDRRIELRARIELEYIRLRRESNTRANDLIDATTEGIEVFESLEDHRALGRSWLISGWVQGGRRCKHEMWADAAERAVHHYRTAAWPTSTPRGELAAAVAWGPTPVDEAIAICERLLDDADRQGAAYVGALLGGLFAQRGEFGRARALVDSARTTLNDLGLKTLAVTYCAHVLGEIELLAGDPATAERVLRELCDELEHAKDFSQLASRASELAEALVLQGRLEEADEWTRLAERHAAPDDVHAQIRSRPVRARIHALRGALDVAEDLAREGATLSDTTDDLNRRAKAHRDLGEVLRLAGRTADSASAFQRALALFELKGNRPAAAQVRALQSDLALV